MSELTGSPVTNEKVQMAIFDFDNSYEVAEKARQDKKNAILENRDSLINDFFRYIESAKDVLVYDDYMMSIIIEETNSMFLEDKDPSEAAKLIVSRVEMYFAERK